MQWRHDDIVGTYIVVLEPVQYGERGITWCVEVIAQSAYYPDFEVSRKMSITGNADVIFNQIRVFIQGLQEIMSEVKETHNIIKMKLDLHYGEGFHEEKETV